jgi:hypothetical protein
MRFNHHPLLCVGSSSPPSDLTAGWRLFCEGAFELLVTDVPSLGAGGQRVRRVEGSGGD